MFSKIISATFVLFASTAAQAGCFGAGEPLFHCTFNAGKKSVDVCLQGDVLLYRFGPPNGRAELALARREIGVEMTPWNGVGRSIYEEITVYNGAYSYILSYAIDRNIEGAPIDGRLIVAQGDSEVASLVCDKGSVKEADFYPLFEAKEAAGQLYCPQRFSWGQGC